MLYIGVDLGTSAVKLLLMDELGKIHRIVSKEYPLYFPNPGWSEQNPSDWLEQSLAGMKELLADCDKTQVRGISFGGQMHGLVALDQEDNVLRPAILWNDGRTTKETEYLNQIIGKDKLSKYTANIAFAGFTAPKILWMKENEPELFSRICKIMLPKDYLAYQLSGTFCTDYSDASGMLLLDVEHKCWSKEMLQICGITEEQLPRLYESYEVVGTLKEELAKELGLSTEVKIIAGAGDNASGNVDVTKTSAKAILAVQQAQQQAPLVNEAMINMAAESKITELKNADPDFDEVASELWNVMENDEYFANIKFTDPEMAKNAIGAAYQMAKQKVETAKANIKINNARTEAYNSKQQKVLNNDNSNVAKNNNKGQQKLSDEDKIKESIVGAKPIRF